MYDRKWLETQIVRMGEKYPERVGLADRRCNEDCSDHCILGQIDHDHGRCMIRGTCIIYRYDEALHLASSAAGLNNAGVPWGEIPKRLGLVPGEQPIDDPGASTPPSRPSQEPDEADEPAEVAACPAS